LKNASLDHRKHKRYAVTDDAIAASNRKIGRIINISEGGMAVNWISVEPFLCDNKVTILCRTENLFIKDLLIRMVRNNNKPFGFMSTFQIRSMGVEFNYSNTEQHNQVKQYISRLAEGQLPHA